MPSSAAGRSTASWARCPRARSSSSSIAWCRRPAARRAKPAAPTILPRRSSTPSRRWRRTTSRSQPRSTTRSWRSRPTIWRRSPVSRAATSQAGNVDQAKAMLAKVPAKDKTNAEIVAAQAALDLAEQAKAAGPVGDLKAKAAAPTPRTSRPASISRSPIGRAASARRRSTSCSAMIKLDRNWNEEAARQQLLKFFEALGFDRSAGRRRPQAAVDHPVLVSRAQPVRSRSSSSCPTRCRSSRCRACCCCRGGKLPLNIFEPRYLAMIFDALAGHRLIGMVQPMQPGGYAGDGLPTDDGRPKVHKVGCAGRIVSFNETEDGRLLLTLSGVCRFEVGRELDAGAGRLSPRLVDLLALPRRPRPGRRGGRARPRAADGGAGRLLPRQEPVDRLGGGEAGGRRAISSPRCRWSCRSVRSRSRRCSRPPTPRRAPSFWSLSWRWRRFGQPPDTPQRAN